MFEWSDFTTAFWAFFLILPIVSFIHQLGELTKKEFDLLYYLLQNKQQVLTREQIVETVWGYDYMGDTNVVDVYIRYLRKKVESSNAPTMIQTVRGVGYILKVQT